MLVEPAKYRSNDGGIMNVKPTNRNILIELPIEEVEESSSTFLLPDDYRRKEIERYTTVNIIEVSADCQKFNELHKNTRCVVESTMIHDISIDGATYSIVAENYVVLLLED